MVMYVAGTVKAVVMYVVISITGTVKAVVMCVVISITGTLKAVFMCVTGILKAVGYVCMVMCVTVILKAVVMCVTGTVKEVVTCVIMCMGHRMQWFCVCGYVCCRDTEGSGYIYVWLCVLQRH